VVGRGGVSKKDQKRSAPAQHVPDTTAGSLDGFPTAPDLPSQWHREHELREGKADKGCWWYSSHAVGQEPGGRFDLTQPHGTCYLGETARVAVRERCGRFLSAHKPIPMWHMRGRVVSTMVVDPFPDPVADLTAADAGDFGVTGELAGGNDYEVAAAWAQALFDAGHAALLYQPRFTPGGERALAVFGEASDPTGPSLVPPMRLVETVALVQAVEGLGYKVRRSTIPSNAAIAADDSAQPEDA
jgi:hypothetical protein